MNIALITAGGTGTRVGREVPKQFLTVRDKPIIIYTLEKFQFHGEIDAIVVVCLACWQEPLKAYCQQFGITKLVGVVNGGDSGFGSIINGLGEIKKMYKDDDFCIIHESVRPNVTAEMLSDSLRVAERMGGAVAAQKSEDELLNMEGKLIDRDDFLIIQNPHTFRLGELYNAYKTASERGITESLGTAVLMSKLGARFGFSLGGIDNIKITTRRDIEYFKVASEAVN
jgi:2-C-methyl-D-erythritol 4-phosphate cytidylyltransferase